MKSFFLTLFLFVSASFQANAFVKGSGVADGYISTVFLPVSVVEKLLPKQLILDDEFTFARQTPVVFFIGSHENLKAGKVRIVKHYNEVTMNLFVTDAKTQTLKATHIVKIRVDSFRALVMGRWVGMPKKRGNFDMIDGTFEVETRKGKLLMTAKPTPVENYDQAAFERNLAQVIAIQEERPIAVVRGKRLRCIEFDWNFADSEVSPAQIEWGFTEKLFGFEIAKAVSPGLNVDKFGSFSVRTKWSMQPPKSCN